MQNRNKSGKKWRSLILVSLIFAATPMQKLFSNNSGAEISDQARQKVDSKIIVKLVERKPQKVLLILDNTGVVKQAKGLQKQNKVRGSSDQIIGFKASEYAKMKSNLIAKMPGYGFTVLRDYSHLPSMYVEVRNIHVLNALARHADVALILENGKNKTNVVESVPLVGSTVGNTDGAGSTIAILDTGALLNKPIFGNCINAGDPGCRVVYMQDFAIEDNQQDADGHGTNVSAIAATVAGDADLVVLDVFEGAGAWDTDINAAINWVIANRNIYNIVALNMSLGDSSTHYYEHCGNDFAASTISEARAAGVASVIASGNDFVHEGISSPACAPGAVSVGGVYDSGTGSIDWDWRCVDLSWYSFDKTVICGDKLPFEYIEQADEIASFSNSADYLTFLAPATAPLAFGDVGITAAGITMRGTSQAAPHVAGAFAVLATEFPGQSVSWYIQRLQQTGVLVTDARNGRVTPRIDIQAAKNAGPPVVNWQVPVDNLFR